MIPGFWFPFLLSTKIITSLDENYGVTKRRLLLIKINEMVLRLSVCHRCLASGISLFYGTLQGLVAG
jgi:hypothetical protein